MEIGRCFPFPADAYWNAERGRWTAAIRGTTGSHQTSEAPVSPSASRIASEQRLALAALGPAQPHIGSSAIRSAAVIKPWVGRTQAVGHRVIPLDRINSVTASQSSSDIFTPPY